MPFHGKSKISAIHIIHNFEYANEAARLAAVGFTADDLDKAAKQLDNLSYWLLSSISPITWTPLAGAGAGSADFSAVSINQVPFNAGSQVFQDSGATVDPSTKIWTFASSIVVPQASIDISDPLSISEATFEVFTRNRVFGTSSVNTSSIIDADQGTGPLLFNQLPSGQNVIAQPDFSQNLTSNPLIVPLLSTLTNQTDKITIKTGAAMTNFRATVTDNLSGIVVKYIPSKAVVDAGVGGLDLRLGDNTLDLNNDLTDIPANGLFFMGFTPLRQLAGQESTLTIEADNVNILGNIGGIPFFLNEIHFINEVSVPFTNDVTNVSDNYTRLNNEHTSTTAKPGGIVVTFDATMVADVLSLAQFDAGVASTSNPIVETDGSDTFAQGDLIQITTGKGLNDGLYEVEDHTGIFLTIRGVGTVPTVESFTATDFITTVDTGTVTKVSVSVIRAGTSGVWEVGIGSESGIAFINFGSGLDVSVIPQIVSSSTVASVNLNAGIPYQLIFGGSAQATDNISLSASGDITILISGTYIFNILINADTTVNTDVNLWVRALVDGVQLGRTIHSGMTSNGDQSSIESALELSVQADEVITFEAVTDNSAVGLSQEDPSIVGWSPSECETIRITNRVTS